VGERAGRVNRGRKEKWWGGLGRTEGMREQVRIWEERSVEGEKIGAEGRLNGEEWGERSGGRVVRRVCRASVGRGGERWRG